MLMEYCNQKRAYADSYGLCLVELEAGDVAEKVIMDLEKEREWHEQSFTFKERLSEYTNKCSRGDIIYKGDLLLFDTHRVFLG